MMKTFLLRTAPPPDFGFVREEISRELRKFGTAGLTSSSSANGLGETFAVCFADEADEVWNLADECKKSCFSRGVVFFPFTDAPYVLTQIFRENTANLSLISPRLLSLPESLLQDWFQQTELTPQKIKRQKIFWTALLLYAGGCMPTPLSAADAVRKILTKPGWREREQ